MSTRAKYVCTEVSKRLAWNSKERFVYAAKMMAVTGGSPENEKFFEYTPTGNLEIGTYKEDVFQPGQEYYLDFTEVPKQ